MNNIKSYAKRVLAWLGVFPLLLFVNFVLASFLLLVFWLKSPSEAWSITEPRKM